jgi:CheY-like chemotaxis protein
MNLSVNARDAMPEGGRIRISTHETEIDSEFASLNPWAREGSFVVLAFSDDGIGMPPENLERVFEPFFTTKPVGCGTGLGLATVYGIVKQHNGFLRLMSEPGKGTTFEIYLPMGGEIEPASEREQRDAGIHGGTETILIAEDDPGVRSFAVRILQSAGYRILEAVDGMEALSIFEENIDRIDLSILDLVMPRLDGRALRDRIRGINPIAKILFTTGYAQTHFSEFFRNDSPVLEEEFLEKPFPPNELLRSVRKILDQKPAIRPLAP